MRYEKVAPISRQEAEVILESKNVEEITKALLGIACYDEGWQWVQATCLQFLSYPDKAVCAIAATSLGHLARLHKTIDTAIVVPALEALLSDPIVAGKAADALDDIAIFVKNKPDAR